MEEKEFKKRFEYGKKLWVETFLPYIWSDRIICEGYTYSHKFSSSQEFLHLQNLTLSPTEWMEFHCRVNRKIPEANWIVGFDKVDKAERKKYIDTEMRIVEIGEELGSERFDGHEALMELIRADKKLASLSSALYESDLLKHFSFLVQDIDVLKEEYSGVGLGVEEPKDAPKEVKQQLLTSSVDFVRDTTHAAQLCLVTGKAVYDMTWDKYLDLFRSGEDPGRVFHITLELIEGLMAMLDKLGFEPPIGVRRMMHRESEVSYQMRLEARRRLMSPIMNYLSKPDPLEKEAVKELNTIYETIETLFKDWEKQFSWKKHEAFDWTCSRLTKTFTLSGTRHPLIVRYWRLTKGDEKEDSPYRGVAKRARKGKSLRERTVAQFLSAILEWIGPGEDLANAEINATIGQVRDQLERRRSVPHDGPDCQVCQTPNPKGLSSCYWCHAPL